MVGVGDGGITDVIDDDVGGIAEDDVDAEVLVVGITAELGVTVDVNVDVGIGV